MLYRAIQDQAYVIGLDKVVLDPSFLQVWEIGAAAIIGACLIGFAIVRVCMRRRSA